MIPRAYIDMTTATRNRTDTHWPIWLVAILLLAAGLRTGMVHVANSRPDRFMWPDSQRYLLVAENIATGQGPIVSAADRTGADPGYPLLLSWPARYWPGQVEKVAAAGRWLNVPAGVATVLFVAYLGRLLFGARAGLIGAAMLAVHPIQVYFHGLVLTEVMYTALLMGSLYVLARYMAGANGANLFFAAIGLGLASLTRSSGLFLPLLLLPMVAYAGWRRTERGRFGQATASVLVFGVCYGCVLAPMAYRNYRIVGAMVPVRTGAGATLLEGNGPWADGGPGMEKVQWPQYPAGASEYVKDKINRQAAITYIQQDPSRFARLMGGKFLRTWNVRMNFSDYTSPLYDLLALLSTVPIYLLLSVGWWRHRRQVSAWYMLLVPAVYFSLLHMVFVGSVRYRFPAVPALVVLAGAAFATLRKTDSTPMSAATQQVRSA